MKYKIIVLDLDGTLTNSKKEVSKNTKDALIDIQERGYKVAIASGRPTSGVTKIAEELNLSKYGGYMLSYNGAKITDCRTGEVVFNKTLPQSSIADIYNIAKETNVGVISYDTGKVISGNGINDYIELESRINGLEILDNGLLSIYYSEPFFLEIMPQNVDKAQSLLTLLNTIGIDSDEMICCGDGFNDISMIEVAGLGVAMENAQDIVKSSADYITLSNDDEGILHVINKFMND